MRAANQHRLLSMALGFDAVLCSLLRLPFLIGPTSPGLLGYLSGLRNFKHGSEKLGLPPVHLVDLFQPRNYELLYHIEVPREHQFPNANGWCTTAVLTLS